MKMVRGRQSRPELLSWTSSTPWDMKIELHKSKTRKIWNPNIQNDSFRGNSHFRYNGFPEYRNLHGIISARGGWAEPQIQDYHPSTILELG